MFGVGPEIDLDETNATASFNTIVDTLEST